MDPQEPDGRARKPAREEEPLTLHVFILLSDFVGARINPLVTRIPRDADDNISRALRALRNHVVVYSSACGLFERWRTTDDRDERDRLEQRVCWAWDGLCGIAWEWEDHPDYRVDLFGRVHHTLSTRD